MTRAATIAGLSALALLWLGPPAVGVEHSMTAHMVVHVGVVAVAAPLLALGVSGHRLNPARRWPALFNPIAVSLLDLVLIWVWHAPALHRAARTMPAAFAGEQASFLVAGLAIWLCALAGWRASGAKAALAGVVALLFTSMHMTLLGALIALAPRPLYHAALDDQQVAGLVMLAVGGAVYLAGGLALMGRVLGRSTAPKGATTAPGGRP